MSVTETLVVPSMAEAPPNEIDELEARTAREKAWYKGWPVFADMNALHSAIERGLLAPVTEGPNHARVGRLRNPDLFRGTGAYLRPDSVKALNTIGRLWRLQLQAEGIDNPIARLSVTSMVRSRTHQLRLVREREEKGGKLATPNSTHCVGSAFDLDASGYYHDDPAHGLIPIVHPDRNTAGMQHIASILQAESGDKAYPFLAQSDGFRPELMESLVVVVDQLHARGFVNRVVEYVDQPHQGLHIAPNPAVDWHQPIVLQ